MAVNKTMHLGSFGHSNKLWKALPVVGEILENNYGTKFRVLDVKGSTGNFKVLLEKVGSKEA